MVLATVVAVCWSIASLVERAVTSHHGIVADGSRIATQPLWFLTAWVPFTVFADVLTRASRRIIPVVAACLLVMTVTDLVRFVGGAPRWVGYPGFFAAWAVPWVMGAWWRQRHDEGGVDERRAGLTIGLLAIAMGSLLVAFLGYHAALIDAVPGHRSNTTPPTLFTAVASLVQFGLFLIVARRLDGIARRHVRAVRTLEALAPGLYVWHLTALSLWGALLAAGLWAPDRLTLAWWLTRPAWFAAVIGVSIVFSLATRRALATMQATRQSAEVRTGVVIASTAAATVAFGLTGLFGPDTSVMATAIAILALAASAGFLMSPRQTAA